MPDKPPTEHIKDFQGGGLLVVRGGALYFIPEAAFATFRCPEAIQQKSQGVSEQYFKKEGTLPPGMSPSDLEEPNFMHMQVMNALANTAYTLAGVERANWIDRIDNDPSRPKSKIEGNTLFTYDKQINKICVDLSKGSKPSKV